MKFSEYLTQKRKEKNLSIRQLALYSDVSHAYISQLEKENRGIPTPDILKKLAKGLKVPYEELMEVAGYVGGTSYSGPETTKKLSKDERDIAKQMIEFTQNIENSDALAFDGEPMSKEAKESLIESMEHVFRQTQRINKKYTPKKYRDDQ